MKVFNIYSKKTDLNEVEVVRDGFCIEAFLFGTIWAFYRKMWIAGILTLLVLVSAYNLRDLYSGMLSDFLEEAVLFAYGFLAYDLIAYKLGASGYILQDVVVADSVEEAELIYLRKINNGIEYVQTR